MVGASDSDGNRLICEKIDEPNKGSRMALKRVNIVLDGVDCVKDEKSGGTILRPANLDRTEYFIKMPGTGAEENVALTDLVFPNGAPVMLRDLSSNPDLNGRMGIVEQYDAAAGKYLVKMSHTQILKMKPERLFL